MQKISGSWRLVMWTAILAYVLAACGGHVEGGKVTPEGDIYKISALHRGEQCVYRLASAGEGVILKFQTTQDPDKPGIETASMPLNPGEERVTTNRISENGEMFVGSINGKEVFCMAPEVILMSGEKLTCNLITGQETTEMNCRR